MLILQAKYATFCEEYEKIFFKLFSIFCGSKLQQNANYKAQNILSKDEKAQALLFWEKLKILAYFSPMNCTFCNEQNVHT